MKKKIIMVLSLIAIFVTGCNSMKTPTNKVEMFLSKYQTMDSDVLSQLENIVSNDVTMSEKQKKDYKALMERQYQNLSYKIKDEKIDGENATVLVEIEVYDYANSIIESRKYFESHKEEFNNKQEEKIKDKIEDFKEMLTPKFIDYKIKQLRDVTNKTKYEINFHLHKKDKEWILEDISDDDRQKLHGLYEE